MRVGSVPAMVAVGMLVLIGCGVAAEEPSAAGLWTGALKVQSVSLTMVFHIDKQATGEYKATIDSPDQGATGIPVGAVTVKGGVLTVEVTAVGGSFEGKFDAKGSTVVGSWRQNGQSLPLTLTRVKKVEGPKRPQMPKPPFPYLAEDVTFENTQATGVKLAGTLTRPKGAGAFPAVVLVTGSGAQDRDETIMGHKPFLVLADYLTRRGIAVLRVDDRGVGGSTGDRAEATTEDFASDTLAAVAFLRTRTDVRPAQIGLIGHSEGGIVAPMAAVKSPDVAFIVLLAGPGVPGDQIILAQQELIARTMGAPEADVQKELGEERRCLEVVKTVKDKAEAGTQLRRIVAESVAGMTQEQRKAAGITEELLDQRTKALVDQMLSPWFRFFIGYDPAPALVKVRVPMLAMWGEKDLQVPPKQSQPVMEAALRQGGNAQATLKVLPGLNHLFQTAKTGSPTEYAQIEETMAPAALKTIGDWILAQTGGK